LDDFGWEPDSCEQAPKDDFGVDLAGIHLELQWTMAESDRLKMVAKEQLREAVYKIGERVSGDPQLRYQAVNFFYWGVPEANDRWIREAFKIVEPLDEITHKHKHQVYCNRCQSPLWVSLRNRKDLQKLGLDRTSLDIICEKCKASDMSEARRRVHVEQSVGTTISKRLQELEDMTYREYLQSPEWKAIRDRRLRSAGYRCQLCNASSRDVQLNVHHRVYDHRGLEKDNDLIVLCQRCHAKFHGK
jgi:RNase P subunit RPR2